MMTVFTESEGESGISSGIIRRPRLASLVAFLEPRSDEEHSFPEHPGMTMTVISAEEAAKRSSGRLSREMGVVCWMQSTRLRCDLPGLIESLKDPLERLKLRAVRKLGNMGAAAAPAVGALAAALQDEPLREAAAEALGRIGPAASEAVPALVQHLGDTDTAAGASVQQALVSIGQSAVPDLLKAVDSPNVLTRRWAAIGLADLGRDEALPALLDVLANPEPFAPWVAPFYLEVLGPKARAAIPALQSVVRRARLEPEDAAFQAAIVLGGIDPDGKEVLGFLLEVLDGPDPSLVRGAVIGLGRIGAEAAAAVPRLVTLLDAEDPEMRSAAAYALGRIGGTDAVNAVPRLCELLRHGEVQVRAAAAAALGSIGPAARECVSTLIELLDDRSSSSNVQEAAAVALGQIGRDAAIAVPVLRRIVEGGAEGLVNLREAAANSLRQITGPPEQRP